MKLLLWLLRLKGFAKLKQNSRALILNYLLESVGGIPYKNLITYEPDGTLLINGKKLELEQAISFRESVILLQNNQAYKVIKEQIAYEAVKYGIHSSLTSEMLLLSKAALWIQQQELKLINDLSGNTDI